MKGKNKDFVPYAEAKALKKLGFTDKFIRTYWITFFGIPIFSSIFEADILAPTYNQVAVWFHSKYKLASITDFIGEGEGYFYKITNFADGLDDMLLGAGFNSEEEAELACVRKLIELMNNGK